MGRKTVAKAKIGDRPANSIELIRGPSLVEPVIGNGESGSQLGSIEEVSGVPVVASVTPRRSPVARSVLPKQVSSGNIVKFIFVKSLPEVLAKYGRSTWCRWT